MARSASKVATQGDGLLRVHDLRKWFPVRRSIGELLGGSPKRYLKAVDGLSFTVGAGESLGLAGESGSGKTVTAEVIAGLQRATSGSIEFAGNTVSSDANRSTMTDFRRNVSMVFQDPFDSLNPRMRVARLLAEPLEVHRIASRVERKRLVLEMLERVRLRPAERFMDKHPYELSGGERQRVAVGRALMLGPRLLIADEPTTMLDVSVRAGILNLIRDVRGQSDMSLLFISHDFSTLSYICDRIAIMYLGHLVEMGPVDAVMARQAHPYTRALAAAIPVPDPAIRRRRVELSIDEAGSRSMRGCPFAPRCPQRMAVCDETRPRAISVAPDHWVACHLFEDESITVGAGAGQLAGDTDDPRPQTERRKERGNGT